MLVVDTRLPVHVKFVVSSPSAAAETYGTNFVVPPGTLMFKTVTPVPGRLETPARPAAGLSVL